VDDVVDGAVVVGAALAGVVVVGVALAEPAEGTVEPLPGEAASDRLTGNVPSFNWLSTWVSRNDRSEV
jgi:hypothetical protein